MSGMWEWGWEEAFEPTHPRNTRNLKTHLLWMLRTRTHRCIRIPHRRRATIPYQVCLVIRSIPWKMTMQTLSFTSIWKSFDEIITSSANSPQNFCLKINYWSWSKNWYRAKWWIFHFFPCIMCSYKYWAHLCIDQQSVEKAFPFKASHGSRQNPCLQHVRGGTVRWETISKSHGFRYDH